MSAADGLHGTFGWSCAAEHGLESETCSGIIVAGTDSEDLTHVFGDGCVEDVLRHPHDYLHREGLELHGTHTLTDEQLEEIFGEGRGAIDPALTPMLNNISCHRLGLDDNTFFIAVAVDPKEGCAYLLTYKMLTAIICNPDDFPEGDDYDLYGTHVLPEPVLDRFFPVIHDAD